MAKEKCVPARWYPAPEISAPPSLGIQLFNMKTALPAHKEAICIYKMHSKLYWNINNRISHWTDLSIFLPSIQHQKNVLVKINLENYYWGIWTWNLSLTSAFLGWFQIQSEAYQVLNKTYQWLSLITRTVGWILSCKYSHYYRKALYVSSYLHILASAVRLTEFHKV